MSEQQQQQQPPAAPPAGQQQHQQPYALSTAPRELLEEDLLVVRQVCAGRGAARGASQAAASETRPSACTQPPQVLLPAHEQLKRELAARDRQIAELLAEKAAREQQQEHGGS
jgi:hypothetical protein